MSEGAGAAAARLKILGAALLFSTGGLAIKATALTGWQVAGYRSGVAALFLWLALPAARRRWTWPAVGVGAAYAATMILFVVANKLTTAAATIFLQSTAPLYLLLLGPLVLDEPVRRRDLTYMAVLAAGLGMFFVGVEPPSDTAPDPLTGNLLATAAGVTWALTVLGLRLLGRSEEEQAVGAGAAAASRVQAHGGGGLAVLVGNVLAFGFCLPWALGLFGGAPVEPAAADVAVVAYLGVVQIGVAYVLLTAALRRVPALEAALLLLTEPVLNPVLAWLGLGERPGPWSLAGGAVILAATAVRTLNEARRRPRTAG